MLGHGERQKLNSNGYSTRLCMENFKIEPEPLSCFPGKEHITFLLPGEKKMGHSKTSRESWKILRGSLKLNCSLQLKRKKRWFQTLQKLSYVLEAMWVSFIYRLNKLITLDLIQR